MFIFGAKNRWRKKKYMKTTDVRKLLDAIRERHIDEIHEICVVDETLDKIAFELAKDIKREKTDTSASASRNTNSLSTLIEKVNRLLAQLNDISDVFKIIDYIKAQRNELHRLAAVGSMMEANVEALTKLIKRTFAGIGTIHSLECDGGNDSIDVCQKSRDIYATIEDSIVQVAANAQQQSAVIMTMTTGTKALSELTTRIARAGIKSGREVSDVMDYIRTLRMELLISSFSPSIGIVDDVNAKVHDSEQEARIRANQLHVDVIRMTYIVWKTCVYRMQHFHRGIDIKIFKEEHRQIGQMLKQQIVSSIIGVERLLRLSELQNTVFDEVTELDMAYEENDALKIKLLILQIKEDIDEMIRLLDGIAAVTAQISTSANRP